MPPSQLLAPAPTPVQPSANPQPKHQLQDPLARAALPLVGLDPDAEQYWLEAIFDSALPNEERDDLIEDLNEEGLTDYKHPGAEDLPLIINRIVIIEQIAPEADEFMLVHLAEATRIC